MSSNWDTFPDGANVTVYPNALTGTVIRRENNPHRDLYVIDINGRPVVVPGSQLVRDGDTDRRPRPPRRH
ncbi:hypothetical protein [Occultella kanbiaonis]|uniref:hypothetical protein n=1 Tax=Occultella kanbiaonis TaxID=2675754 RepID=UPI0013D73669|nr:hypothetical protein [Occultella kanbiaonis]